MPKKTDPLTTRICAVSVCPPIQKVRKLSDGGSGLVLEIKASTKTFTHAYSFAGRRRKLTLGSFPTTSPAQARPNLADAKRSLRDGKDPIEKRREREAEQKKAADDSFGFFFDMWFEQWRAGKTENHVKKVARRADIDLLPHLGRTPIAAITPDRVMQTLMKIQDRGVTETARKVRNIISQVCDFALIVRPGCLIGGNSALPAKPRKFLKSLPVEHRRRVDASEVPELMRSITDYSGTPITRIATLLMAHVFLRTQEMLLAKWEEVDFENQLWRIPACRMKMKKPHLVPLSRQSVVLLRELHSISGGRDLMFPGQNRDGTTLSTGSICGCLKRLGYRGKMTGHGFRGVASTQLHELGFPHQHIEAQLSHTAQSAVAAAYNAAQYLEPRRKMMQAWSDWLDQQRASGKADVLSFNSHIERAA
jgi:integrase